MSRSNLLAIGVEIASSQNTFLAMTVLKQDEIC